jgi:CRISPR system Cascade subunit CasE
MGYRSGLQEVLILSTETPIEPSIGRTIGGEVRRLESKPFRPDLRPEMQVGFDLLINATTIAREPPGPSGRKVRRDVWDAAFMVDGAPGLGRADPYVAFLQRRLAGAAAIRDAGLLERRGWSVRRQLDGAPMRMVAARLVGRLRVQDPAALTALVVAGIGRAKAFGCGLLCLLPPSRLPTRRLPS